MKDINNPLTKAYYDALNGNIAGVQVYEGQEPDDLLDNAYVVITDVSSVNANPKSAFNYDARVLVTINTWKLKYNNRKLLNQIAGQILAIIHPTPQSTLQAAGVKIITTTVDSNDIDYGRIADRQFVSRNLIFSHLVTY